MALEHEQNDNRNKNSRHVKKIFIHENTMQVIIGYWLFIILVFDDDSHYWRD